MLGGGVLGEKAFNKGMFGGEVFGKKVFDGGAFGRRALFIWREERS